MLPVDYFIGSFKQPIKLEILATEAAVDVDCQLFYR